MERCVFLVFLIDTMQIFKERIRVKPEAKKITKRYLGNAESLKV